MDFVLVGINWRNSTIHRMRHCERNEAVSCHIWGIASLACLARTGGKERLAMTLETHDMRLTKTKSA